MSSYQEDSDEEVTTHEYNGAGFPIEDTVNLLGYTNQTESYLATLDAAGDEYDQQMEDDMPSNSLVSRNGLT